MEIRDLTARFASFAGRAAGVHPAAQLQLWQELVGAAHPDVYEAYFARQGDSERFALSLPRLVARGERLTLAAERLAGALEAMHDRVAERIGGVPPRVFCVFLVGDQAEAAWIEPFRDRLTLFFAAEALPEDRLLLRALAAHELMRLFHFARALGWDNRRPLPAGDPLDQLPLGMHLFGYGLGACVAEELLPGLPEGETIWFGACPDVRDWLERCRRSEAAMARALQAELSATQAAAGAAAFRRWLPGEEREAGWPPRAGRYLAGRAVARLSRRRTVARLAALRPATATTVLAGALGEIGSAAGAEPVRPPVGSPFPPELIRFCQLFNAGEYFESHEVLEEAWHATGSDCYHGLILLAAAYVKRDRGNPRGVIRNLVKGLAYLDRVPSPYLGLDLATIRAHVRDCARRAGESGADPAELRSLVPPIRLELLRERLRGDEPELAGP